MGDSIERPLVFQVLLKDLTEASTCRIILESILGVEVGLHG